MTETISMPIPSETQPLPLGKEEEPAALPFVSLQGDVSLCPYLNALQPGFPTEVSDENDFWTNEPTITEADLQGAMEKLYSPAEVDAPNPARIPSEDLLSLQSTLKWTREFIIKPHPKLGRSGAVCPFVKPSLNRNLLFLTVCHGSDPLAIRRIYREILVFASLMWRMDPQSEEALKLRTIMIVLPDIDNAVAHDIIPPLHQKLKTRLLKDKQLIGQFYATCPVPATWNPDFFPLQSPVPMFAIRYLIESDWRFINSNPEWENIFQQFYDPQASTSSFPKKGLEQVSP